jgi:Lar family restriction alleviation protein
MPAEKTKLLPCPFCGGEAIIMQLGTFRRSCVIGCTECHCRLESNEEDSFCGQQWNQRANIKE